MGVIGPEWLKHPALASMLRGMAARDLLRGTPLRRLALLDEMSKPRLWLPSDSQEVPDWADPSQWHRCFKGSLRRVREFVGRLNAAYWDLCDDVGFDEQVEQSMEDGGVFGVRPNLARVLMSASTACGSFDTGHEKALEDIGEVRSKSVEGVAEQYGIAIADWQGRIEALSSTTSDHLQAADIAAGFARSDHQRAGIPGVLARFRAVLYNGKVVRL